MTSLEDIAKSLKAIQEDVHTIKRGVYGDEPNGVLGLIATDKDQHRRIKNLEDTKKKIIYVAIGAFSIIEFIIHLAKSLFQ